jgi:hypothetical protein
LLLRDHMWLWDKGGETLFYLWEWILYTQAWVCELYCPHNDLSDPCNIVGAIHIVFTFCELVHNNCQIDMYLSPSQNLPNYTVVSIDLRFSSQDLYHFPLTCTENVWLATWMEILIVNYSLITIFRLTTLRISSCVDLLKAAGTLDKAFQDGGQNALHHG